MAKFLLTKGVDTGVHDSENTTLLHLALKHPSTELSRLLLSLGLDPFARTKSGCTPFHSAAAAGQISQVHAFLNGSLGIPIEDLDVDHRNNIEETALLMATVGGHFDVASLLLRHKADPSLTDNEGFTVLQEASKKDSPLLLEILEKRVDINLQNAHGYTALHVAACMGNVNGVKQLLEHNARSDIVAKNGRTAVVEAAARYHKQILTLLLEKAQDPHLQIDKYGCNFLDYIRDRSGYDDIMRKPKFRGSGLSPQKKDIIVRRTVREYLPMPITDATKTNVESNVVTTLGHCLMRLRNFEAARICFEQGFRRLKDGEPLAVCWTCDVCQQRCKPGPVYMCTLCADQGIRNECHEKDHEKRPHGCNTAHEYIIHGGETWRKLAEGTVNETGWTYKRWSEEMMKDFPPVHDSGQHATNLQQPPGNGLQINIHPPTVPNSKQADTKNDDTVTAGQNQTGIAPLGAGTGRSDAPPKPRVATNVLGSENRTSVEIPSEAYDISKIAASKRLGSDSVGAGARAHQRFKLKRALTMDDIREMRADQTRDIGDIDRV